jgi:ABC-type branched-subunit amino acid transport system substrate-binding protein
MLTRRNFVFSLAAITAGGRFSRPPGTAPRVLRIALVTPTPHGPYSALEEDVSCGVALSLAETLRAGDLFGQQIQMVETHLEGMSDVTVESTTRDTIRKYDVHVLIGGMSKSRAQALGNAAADTGVVFLNVGAGNNSLRHEDCRRTTYHIAASDAMISSATAAAGVLPSDSSIELWHSSLEKYGAAQLNDRYRARSGCPMTSAAWAGWFAIKCAWEASLRAQSTNPSALMEVFDKDETQFDGHKGAPLSFRRWDHQLRQPLYAVVFEANKERVAAEIPDIAKDSQQSMRDQLDRFGDSGTTPQCVK